MGTFHHGKGELHGITVVVETSGPRVYIGRCDTILPEGVVLLDADHHDDGAEGRAGTPLAKDEYIAQAARFGVWKQHDRVIVPTAEVAGVRPLGEYA